VRCTKELEVARHVDEPLKEMRAKFDRVMEVLNKKTLMVVDDLIQKQKLPFSP
jgi:hypothetical protein